MGPIPGGNNEELYAAFPFLPPPGLLLGTMTYLDRLTFAYQNTNGYNLEIKNVPRGWGDLTVKQYRIDNDNNMTLISTQTISKKQRKDASVMVSGSWVPGGETVRDSVVYDPAPGVAPGIDMIVVHGSTGNHK
jgi:hypothetical protein